LKTTVLYEGSHRWIAFGRDPEKPERIIDTNQYLIRDGERSVILDPGGIETFSSVLAAVMCHARVDQITDLFFSHQDPDVASSLGMWDEALPHARLHAPWLWEGFLRHFGCNNLTYVGIPDEGGTIALSHVTLQLVPAHYLHSSGNIHVYDPIAKILFSGDVGAALEPPEGPMFVDEFAAHVPKMTLFHQRWMPSNRAKSDWIERVRKLDIAMMVPQHGRIFRGDDVKRFLDWFDALEVGVAIPRPHPNAAAARPAA
jgi:flavorubredoxin